MYGRTGVYAAAGEAVPGACLRLLRRRRRGELTPLAPHCGAGVESCPSCLPSEHRHVHPPLFCSRAHRAHRGRRPGRRSRLLGHRHRPLQASRRRRRTPDPSPDPVGRQLHLPARHRTGPPRAVRLVAGGASAGRPRRPQPGHRLRARAGRADHHHRQHVGPAVGTRTGHHHAARRTPTPRAHPAHARSGGRRGTRRSAAGRLPARRHRRHGRHHPHRGLDRILCPVRGADPAPAARRLLADRGARPAGRPP